MRISRTGDHFTALDSDEAIKLPEGEVVYATGATILTRHFVWRQAKAGLISSNITNVLLLSEILPQLPLSAVDEVRASFEYGFRKYFGVSTETHVLSERESCWEVTASHLPARNMGKQ